VEIPSFKLKRLSLFLIGLGLLANSISLLFLQVSNFGVQLPLALGLVFLCLAWKWPKLQQRLAENRRLRWFWHLSWKMFALWVISLVGFFALLHKQGIDSDLTGFEPQALVVLGSSTPNGKASPTLAMRWEKTLALAQLYPRAIVVVSGGKDVGQILTEAQVMGEYLRKGSLQHARLVQEEASSSTYENLLFTRRLLLQKGLGEDPRLIVITSDFHTLRARWIANRVGLNQLRMAAAPTPLYLRYNAWLREYFAFVSGWIFREF